MTTKRLNDIVLVVGILGFTFCLRGTLDQRSAMWPLGEGFFGYLVFLGLMRRRK